MNPQRYSGQQPQVNPEDSHQAMAADHAASEPNRAEVEAKSEQAARSVMHPDSYDPEWRYYHGAWGG